MKTFAQPTFANQIKAIGDVLKELKSKYIAIQIYSDNDYSYKFTDGKNFFFEAKREDKPMGDAWKITGSIHKFLDICKCVKKDTLDVKISYEQVPNPKASKLIFTILEKDGGEIVAELPNDDPNADIPNFFDTDHLYSSIVIQAVKAKDIAAHIKEASGLLETNSYSSYATALHFYVLHDPERVKISTINGRHITERIFNISGAGGSLHIKKEDIGAIAKLMSVTDSKVEIRWDYVKDCHQYDPPQHNTVEVTGWMSDWTTMILRFDEPSNNRVKNPDVSLIGKNEKVLSEFVAPAAKILDLCKKEIGSAKDVDVIFEKGKITFHNTKSNMRKVKEHNFLLTEPVNARLNGSLLYKFLKLMPLDDSCHLKFMGPESDKEGKISLCEVCSNFTGSEHFGWLMAKNDDQEFYN